MKPVGVVLSGCGVFDGAEIHESVLTLLYLDQKQFPYQCLAPDINQMHVVDHRTGKEMNETRNVLTEAARIARGKIEPLRDAWVDKLSAVIFPGGFGAAKNYCDYALKGKDCTMNPQVENFMRKCINAKLPVGMLCISPVVLARALMGTDVHPTLTVGAESADAESVVTFGAKHEVRAVTDIVVDHEHRIVSAPAYMYDAHIADVAQGIEKLVTEIAAMIRQTDTAAAHA
jgi:enhancing lycopene biosynthesis protein 2